MKLGQSLDRTIAKLSRRPSGPKVFLYLALLLISCAALIGFPDLYQVASTSNHPMAFVYPVMAPRKSSNYGMRIHPIRHFSQKHSGVDLAAPIGSPIRAIAAGRVVFADRYAGYGNFVVIQHADHMTSHYGHCYSLKVKTGQLVKAGQIVAYIGNTGLSTGPHLHFEIRIDGKPIDPERMMPDLASPAEG